MLCTAPKKHGRARRFLCRTRQQAAMANYISVVIQVRHHNVQPERKKSLRQRKDHKAQLTSGTELQRSVDRMKKGILHVWFLQKDRLYSSLFLHCKIQGQHDGSCKGEKRTEHQQESICILRMWTDVIGIRVPQWKEEPQSLFRLFLLFLHLLKPSKNGMRFLAT